MLQHQVDRFAGAHRATMIPFALVVTLLFFTSVSQPAQSQTYKVIHNFTNQGSDGASPFGGPVFDRFGNLYGTTWLGGIYGAGSVYKLSPHGSSWKYSSLYSFKAQTDGSGPGYGTLVIRHDGTLFGTTEGGGYFGTTFSVQPTADHCGRPQGPWHETVLHRFGHGEDGAEPMSGVAFDAKGNFYGTTLLGGAYANGTVFEAKRSGKGWTTSVIYSFGGSTSDAINPVAAPTIDHHGNLYGTAPAGGAYGGGAVFKLSRSDSGWKETVLYSFQGQSDGQNPVGGLILDDDGNLYGTTFDGGVNGGGTVYKLSPSREGWTFTVIYSLPGGYGGPYNKLTLDRKGNIYGFTNSEAAHGFGSVFKLTPSDGSWTFTDLYDFTNGKDGGFPYGSLAVDDDGNIFGTAFDGGSQNQGVVFEITPE